MPVISDTESFIEKAKETHGDTYDYSKVVYVKATSKVTIICPIHGEFLQTPSNHLTNKQGCPVCGKIKSIQTLMKSKAESFVDRSRKVHGDRYDYSKAVYTGTRIPLTIICPIHGEFKQQPTNHLSGSGCPKCNKNLENLKRVEYHSSIFVDRARQIHGDFYDYSEVVYGCNGHELVTIICPIHGKFNQSPSNHLINEQGCPVCGIEKTKETKKRNFSNKFIKRAKEIHGDFYDYSESVYTNAKEKIKIICPHHGEFLQTPNKHLYGQGCPVCSKYHYTTPTYDIAGSANVYLLKIYNDVECFLKLGITKNVETRVKEITKDVSKYGLDVELITFKTVHAKVAFEEERAIHEGFVYKRHYCKHKFEGFTECYDMCELDRLVTKVSEL